MLSTKDKENMVIDLLGKGYTLMDIAKSAHVSFSYVGKIRKVVLGEVDDDKEVSKPLSVPSQAFKLFLDGKPPVEVAIIVDLDTQEVLRMFHDYLMLQNMHRVVMILKEHKGDLAPFLKLFHHIKENKTRVKDIRYAVDNVNKINALEQRKESIIKEVELIESKRDYLIDNLGDLQQRYS